MTAKITLVFEVDAAKQRVMLWMVGRSEAIRDRLDPMRKTATAATGSITPATLDEWGLDPRHWPLLTGKPMTPRSILELEPKLGGETVSSLLQCLLPQSIPEISRGPSREIGAEQDEIAGKQLDHFLLVLEPEQSETLQRFTRALKRQPGSASGPWLLKGGPGSGKSTISLYCIHEILDSPPGLFGEPPKILFTTFTRALERSAESLLGAWGREAASRVAMKTINQLAASHDNKPGRLGYELLTDLSRREQSDFVRDVTIGVQGACPFGTTNDAMGTLLNEIEDFICGFGLKSLAEYLQVERHGRRKPLPRPGREYVWQVHERLKARLRDRKLTTYTRRAFAAFLNTEQLDPGKKWDYLFIDEAQDLRPIQIRLCMNLCKDPKNIFLTADVNQGIYNTGTSWKSISAELRFQGRTTLLKRNHRNSAAISSAIQLLAPNGTESDRETLGLDSRDPRGSKPTIARVRGGLVDEASIRRVADFLEAGAIEERVGFGCCAILVPTKVVGELWQERLPAHFNARFFESATVDIGHPGVKLLTIHASKGLQFPVVSVVGITKDALKFLGPKDDPEAADEVRRRLLFVACSRAMRHLYLQTSSDDPTNLLDPVLKRRDLWNVEEVSSTNATLAHGLDEVEPF